MIKEVEKINCILEGFAQLTLPSYETRVFLTILGQTFGKHKSKSRIKLSKFEKMTKINRRHIYRAIKGLIVRGIVIKETKSNKHYYSINETFFRNMQ